jgi:predicted Zn-dependent protease
MILAAAIPTQGEAKSLRLVRDSEVENIIRAYATPLFQAAGLNPKAIDVYLVQDPRLNAFVTSGLNMFINTGLLMRTDDPLQVIGVVAHETGHLAAGHTATRNENVRRSTKGVIASYVIGLAAAIATGRPEFASAVISGGQDIALKGLLNYTRSQESTADQVAIRLLNGTGQSPRGLLEFMRILGGQEVLLRASQDPYLRSHPLTQDRVAFLEDQVQKSPFGSAHASPGFVMLHDRMQAKLIGFLQPMERVLRRYPESDDSLPARYARAIAHYRNSGLTTALGLTEALIAESPDDPYFRELKGQMLFENGRVTEALPAYEAAARLLPDSPQLRLGLAQVLIEINEPALDEKALVSLAQTLRHEPDNSFAWRLSAIAYGRRGDVGLTALALAESALARGKPKEAREQATRAQKILAEGSVGWLRAADIENTATRMVKRR